MKDKKGMILPTIDLFKFLFGFLFVGIFLGIGLFAFNTAVDELRMDVEVGQVNFGEVVNSTIGQIDTAFSSNADTLGIIILLSMCLLLVLNAYFLGEETPKAFLVIDIIIILFAFITSVYLTQTYNTLITSTSVFSVFIDDIPNTSTFILRLPQIVGTLGALILIVSYSGIRRRRQGGLNVSNF